MNLLQRLAFVACLCAPWLINPAVTGPSPAVPQLLLAVAASGGLLAVGPAALVSRGAGAWLAFLIVAAAAQSRLEPTDLARLAAFASIVLVGMVVGTGAATAGDSTSTRDIAHAWTLVGLVGAVLAFFQFQGAAIAGHAWLAAAPEGVAYANLRQRNHFATSLQIAWAGLLWSAARVQVRGDLRPLQAALVVACTCVLAIGNLMSSSRTGLLQTCFVLAATASWGMWRHTLVRWSVAAYVFAYGCGVLLVAGSGATRLGTAVSRLADSAGCSSRALLWTNVLELIGQRPVLGWGWGGLAQAHFQTNYATGRFCEILDNAHFLPLQLAVELGVPLAAVLSISGIVALLRRRPWRQTDPTRQMAWLVLGVLLIHSALEYPLWYGPFQMAFGLALGFILADPHRREHRLGGVPRGVVALLLVMGATYAARDYWRISQLFLPVQSRAAAYREHTLAKVSDSWLFRDQVRFAELVTTPLTIDNAARLHALAQQVLHYSPEPQVIEKLIDSAALLGMTDEADFHAARYAAAFPAEHARWRATRRDPR